jgi:hypothetical protein
MAHSFAIAELNFRAGTRAGIARHEWSGVVAASRAREAKARRYVIELLAREEKRSLKDARRTLHQLAS